MKIISVLLPTSKNLSKKQVIYDLTKDIVSHDVHLVSIGELGFTPINTIPAKKVLSTTEKRVNITIYSFNDLKTPELKALINLEEFLFKGAILVKKPGSIPDKTILDAIKLMNFLTDFTSDLKLEIELQHLYSSELICTTMSSRAIIRVKI